MESRLVKGLYFAGELLDVDGICGGYNLQWAWSSGAIAGMAAARGKKKRTGKKKIMIRIHQLKLSIYHKPDELKKKTAKMLRISPEQIRSLHIVRQSVDARKKEDILYIYTVLVETKGEAELVKRAKNPNITIANEKPYAFPAEGDNAH